MLVIFVLFVALAVGLILYSKRQVASGENQGGEKNKKEAKTPEEIKKEEEEAARKNWMALIVLFIVTISIAYMLPDDSSMFIVIGAVVVIPLHIMGLWLLFTGSKVSEVTKVMVIGYFAIAVVGLILPEPIYQTWKDTKASVNAANRPTFFKEVFSASPSAGGGESKKEEGMWMLFDPDVYTLARPGDRESIFIDDPETWVQLPEVPKGFEAIVACGSASMKIYWKDVPDGQEVVCKDLVLRDLDGLIIRVSPNEVGEVISVRLKPIKKKV